jgi:hypothetical protein
MIDGSVVSYIDAKQRRYLCCEAESVRRHPRVCLATGSRLPSDDRLMPWPILHSTWSYPTLPVQRYRHDPRVPLILPLGCCKHGCNDTLGRAGVPSCRELSHLLGIIVSWLLTPRNLLHQKRKCLKALVAMFWLDWT